MPFHPVLCFNVSCSSEAFPFYQIEDLIFAAYVWNLSSTRYDFRNHSINLNIHMISVYWDTVKFPSLSSNESIFPRSIVDNVSDSVADQKVSEIHLSVSSTKSLCFLDPLSRWFGQSCQLKVSELHGEVAKYRQAFLSTDEMSTQGNVDSGKCR